MKKSRFAFTLIELLVVIAIIAILAAILFPVFAQAKAAAKKAVSLSNGKQLALAAIMYADDSDDALEPATAWGADTSGLPLCFDAADCFGSWAFLDLPYIKSGGIFVDPQATTTPNYSNNSNATDYNYPNYGMNYVYLSAWNGSQQHPVTMTSVARPSDTVLFANKWSNPETNLGSEFLGFQFTTALDGPILNYTVEIPNCGVAPGFCNNNWGFLGFGSCNGNLVCGSSTGGDSLRSGNQMVTIFTDGHVKSMAPGAITVGTNWNTNQDPGLLQFTANYQSVYMWNGL